MKRPFVAGWCGIALFVLATGVIAQTNRGASAHSTPVVIAELFTSEGCSSCPPADALLDQIGSEQPIEGAEIIALEEHVDYWDDLGWRDPFSSALFTKRQSAYDARVFRTNDIYTPQLVVNGSTQCTGSDRRAVLRALSAAGQKPAARVAVEVGVSAAGRIPVSVAVDIPSALERHRAADVLVAITENGLRTEVRRGENRGRTVSHGAVVRSIATIGALSATERAATLRADIAVASGWNASNVRVVAFVQERDSRRVLGGAAAPLR